jgi:hypothetical protein
MCFVYSFVFMGIFFCKHGIILYEVGNQLMTNTPLNVVEIFGHLKKYKNVHKSQTMSWRWAKISYHWGNSSIFY